VDVKILVKESKGSNNGARPEGSFPLNHSVVKTLFAGDFDNTN
jgi:hypothetical protein